MDHGRRVHYRSLTSYMFYIGGAYSSDPLDIYKISCFSCFKGRRLFIQQNMN